MKFNVTYEQVTPESAINGDYFDTGYVIKGTDLRDAISLSKIFESPDYPECDTYPVDPSMVRSVRAYRVNDGTTEYYEQGLEESRTLHFPDNITPSSKARILRLLGVRIN